MSFGKCKRRLQSIINRRDLTDALAGDFITDAIADMERKLRIGCMETMLTQGEWDGERNAIIVPTGFLEGINLFTDTTELVQVDIAQFLAMRETAGVPTHFVKIGDRWLLKPTPAPNTNVYFHYYTQSPPLAADDDENVWTRSALNAVVYTAAVLAADHFQMEDEYARRFQARADGYVADISGQDLDEKWSGRINIPLPTDRGDY
ncbi:hypothetical protein [Sphingomonas sp. BK580]|uniref:phage adaptor protein n=1 Tax=Sphingomonas sp. BK580 TaxID=2586972 RepID=UPI00160E3229|nr:hypothetical protein [Sphingomonas sp. BK580]MBB3692999.1 hypothetical protein [Sphingomonas sp. BK580]